MKKNILGSWGASLDDEDYACALAALGVLESSGRNTGRRSSDPSDLAAALEDEFALGDRTPVWGGPEPRTAGTTLTSYETRYGDPAALASAWRECSQRLHHERALPRIAVPLDWHGATDPVNVDDLCSWLQRVDGLNALVLAQPGRGPRAVPWHWPLRVGVPEGPEHAPILAALRTAQRPGHWTQRLARCFAVGSARDACDLLILSDAAARAPDQLPGRIRAGFVACLENPPSHASSAADRYRALRERLHAAGVAAIGRLDATERQLGRWFVEVLRQVSHDVPIHAALRSVGRSLDREPLVLGHPRALDTCRILAIAERQDRIVATLTTLGTDEVTTTAPGDEPTFGGPSAGAGAPPWGGLQPRFADELRSRMFTSESVDGEAVAGDFDRREREIAAARGPRWIQADAWRVDAPATSARSIPPAHWSLMAVHIGPSSARRGDGVFPDDKLDFSRGDVAVNVQLELAGAAVKRLHAPARATPELLRSTVQQMATPESSDADTTGIDGSEILVPPAGDSTRAWFAVYPHKRDGRVDGRISIVHNNRVLQTARVWVAIDGRADRGAGVEVKSEATIHAADDDLLERRVYDVAIQVSDVGGKLHLTIDRDGQPLTVRLDDLSAPIARIAAALDRVARKRDFSKPLLAEQVFTDSLYTLASAGAELEQHLRKRCGHTIDEWERIHLVPSTNEFFPLEYVYGGPPPRIGAAACPNLLAALERGSCDRAAGDATAPAPCPNQRDKAFLCPMHFWGFRRLIERNGTVGVLESGSPDAPTPDPRALCAPSRQAYCQVTSLLFAASERAFLYAPDASSRLAERTKLLTSLGSLCGTVRDVADWDEWRREVTKQPNLLLLIAHTDEHLNTPVLEIGRGNLLGRAEILGDVCGGGGQPQLLILLGCSAADVTENFQPYPERFRDAGVSIVLAPVAPIRGADAVPIARRLALLLAEHIARPEPTAFGELLPLLRRQLLHDGHAGVMAIVGFGDGDWLIGGQPC